MAEKKGFFATLFGGHSGSCCNMEITEEPEKEKKKSGCCDMQIVEEADFKAVPDDKEDK